MKKTEVEFLPGSSTSEAEKSLIEKAPAFGRFNGILMLSKEGETEKTILYRFKLAVKESRKKYLEPDSYKKMMLDEERRIEESQKSMDSLMLEMPKVFGIFDMVDWIGRYSEISQNSKVSSDTKGVIKKIMTFGVTEGSWVGVSRVKTEKKLMAKWLLGQCLEGLYSVGCPHQSAIRFSKECLRMK